jgi:hypothetical protein
MNERAKLFRTAGKWEVAIQRAWFINLKSQSQKGRTVVVHDGDVKSASRTSTLKLGTTSGGITKSFKFHVPTSYAGVEAICCWLDWSDFSILEDQGDLYVVTDKDLSFGVDSGLVL